MPALACVNMKTVSFLLVLSLATAAAAQGECVEKTYVCSNYFNARLNTGREALCRSLATYWQCLKNIKETTPSCQSNIHYHGLLSSISFRLDKHNCSDVSVANFSIPQRMTPPTSESACGLHRRKAMSVSTQNCGMFGDPHLRTFSENTETCVVHGAWPMLDNEYLAVQVTNVYLLPGSTATATSKVRRLMDLFFLLVITWDFRQTTLSLNYVWYHAVHGLILFPSIPCSSIHSVVFVDPFAWLSPMSGNGFCGGW